MNVAFIVIKDGYFEVAEYQFILLHFEDLINLYLINLDLMD